MLNKQIVDGRRLAHVDAHASNVRLLLCPAEWGLSVANSVIRYTELDLAEGSALNAHQVE